ncbi:hypothetical protein D9623_27260 (plasmid) [Azospirillum brasilense]|uniref:Uncharacterized protein n=1 Tax=Azospirillum brasilense TaxID=192 RepID=A0A0N7I8P3_AZOBR|nr:MULTISPECIES: hypothetical protein [Azospirillum]ALJ37851.1 hypothetical protein AMK58_20775 [Azospirillum brasilense]MDW7554827.1 hypothetical protein [Azospirillum brasilense]MDW7597166.1 hypothetical protein [Azospirillum brasilense]MDW7632011.1 hypothetical protein [Azospirillum brasilense]MDX5951946.1 hypothetical protein [Azospirillum brasilense]
MSDLTSLLRNALNDPATGWSLGAFGAIAEFIRDPDEPATLRDDGPELEARTARGGLRLRPTPAIRAVPYRTRSGSLAVALCLPRHVGAMNRRGVVTELGPDREAIAEADRDALLFDLGLGVFQTDVCVRSSDPVTIARLRAVAGTELLAPGNPLPPDLPALSPDRVFIGPFGRIEVSQPIPPPDGRSPEGPHTHVLPKLLAHNRTHAATVPIPDGWVPSLYLSPPAESFAAWEGLGH